MVQLQSRGGGVKAVFWGQTGTALGVLFMVKRVGMVLRNLHQKAVVHLVSSSSCCTQQCHHRVTRSHQLFPSGVLGNAGAGGRVGWAPKS